MRPELWSMRYLYFKRIHGGYQYALNVKILYQKYFIIFTNRYVIFHLFIVCFITLNMIYNIDLNDTIKKAFRALNDEDIGQMYDIANGHVLVKRGIIDKEKIPFPKTTKKVIKVSFR